jgi:acyl carrier protein
MESRVAAVWQEVLGIGNIGIHENFFDLGGNSLLLITLTGRLQDKLQRKISILEIFRDPTISSFVARLGGETDDSSAYEHVRARAARRRASTNRRKSRHRRE